MSTPVKGARPGTQVASSPLPRSAQELLYEFASKQTLGSPMSAMIEVADRCNEVCVHCYQGQGMKGEMTTEEIFGINIRT